ncbi:MAG TPA: chromate transporter [Burkholderiales bacterium]|nr:chromate transporter [Burkholderiales bacterium]
MATALGLFLHFLVLGCLAVGGVSTVMPDMHRYVVDELGLVTPRQFADAYALAQAAPGPNALWVTVLGLQAAGGLGALATTLGVLIPATSFSYVASLLHAKHADSPLALAFRRGLAPVALGFMLASCWLLLLGVGHDWRSYALAFAALGVALKTDLNPLWLLAAGGALGIAGLV